MIYYQTISKGYEELYKEEQLTKLRLIKSNLNLKGNEKILDIGCGPFWSKDYFEKIIGIDPEFEGDNIIKAKAESLPFKDNTFDVMLCITAVHHFELKRAFSEMKRAAKNNAVLAITILKKSPRFNEIRSEIMLNFKVVKTIEEEKDTLFILRF